MSIETSNHTSASDATTLLGINNPDTRSLSCVGHAKTQHRRCRNTIAKHNVSSAETLLAGLPNISANRPMLKRQLLEIASMTLCRRWHQGQAQQVADEWYTLIETELRRRSRHTVAPRDMAGLRESRSLPTTPIIETPSPTPDAAAYQELLRDNARLRSELRRLLGREHARVESQPPEPTPQSRRDASAGSTRVGAPPESDHVVRIDERECPICYESASVPFMTACNHVFCEECMLTWLRTSNSCPCCRRRVTRRI